MKKTINLREGELEGMKEKGSGVIQLLAKNSKIKDETRIIGQKCFNSVVNYKQLCTRFLLFNMNS